MATENKIDVEEIMAQIRVQAAQQEPFEPLAPATVQESGTQPVSSGAKAAVKKIAGKVTRVFVGIYLFIKYQLKSGKNVVLDTAEKGRKMEDYVYGEMESRLCRLEEENNRLKNEVEALQGQNHPQV